LIAKEKFKPDYFLYENNKSAAQAIKNQISHELGVDLQYINSALVSAQNRQRFYAHNFPNVEQPEDRGILLKDILEDFTDEKEYEFAESVGVGFRNRRENDGKLYRRFETHNEPKSNALTTVQTDSMVAEPIRIGTIDNNSRNKNYDSQQYRVYSPEGKSVTICGQGGGVGAKTGLYACPVDFTNRPDSSCKRIIRKVQNEDSKSRTLTASSWKGIESDGMPVIAESVNYHNGLVYEVCNGLIAIKDKQYPIKLSDGYYIIRKLTPIECERLQTLPDNYTAGISNTQRYKCLGNGWTAEVIIHILKHMNIPKDEPIEVLSMYDGIGTGKYCFDKLGYKNITYKAYEIDKYAKQIANKNYPDIIQCGDAFDVRNNNWDYEKI
jgi:DNA (cytosine-5)-methyltransferase 3A